MATTAQQSPQPVAGKRKGKSQFLPAKQARRGDAGGPRQLEPGLQGILITCNMNERKCVEEAYSLLNEYGDDMYGPEKVRALGRASRPWALLGCGGGSCFKAPVQCLNDPAYLPAPKVATIAVMCLVGVGLRAGSLGFLDITNDSDSHVSIAFCGPGSVLKPVRMCTSRVSAKLLQAKI